MSNKNITYMRLKRAAEKSSECFLCDLETEIESKYIDIYLQDCTEYYS